MKQFKIMTMGQEFNVVEVTESQMNEIKMNPEHKEAIAALEVEQGLMLQGEDVTVIVRRIA